MEQDFFRIGVRLARAYLVQRPENFGHVTTVPPTLGPFSKYVFRQKLVAGMATETTSGKDTLKVEKASLLVLGLCIIVLVYLVAFRPF